MARKRTSKHVRRQDAFAELGWPAPTPQSLHHFTLARQVDHLVTAREAEPDLGLMARLMALCSLPRTNPGRRLQYVRRNGPYTLGITAGVNNKLPYGNLPRLLLAWVSTEAVRTQSRVLILGRSLSEFMRKLGLHTSGGVRTRLRNQMKRLFHAQVSLIYEDPQGMESMSSLGLDLYMWLTYRTFALKGPVRLSWRNLYRQFGANPAKADNRLTVNDFRKKCLRELKKIKTAWSGLNYTTARGKLILSASKPRIPRRPLQLVR